MVRGKFNKKKLKDKGDYKMSEAQDDRARKAIAQTDQQVSEARVNFRWEKNKSN